ncbi:YeiH family protein [Saccharopolyspora griseoalba]|uniref:YeiH family protein n=1 Tax=Saccharopolyspora griseoalba TaxID=1431848 RepID=A0ABW2LU12_9PSEU
MSTCADDGYRLAGARSRLASMATTASDHAPLPAPRSGVARLVPGVAVTAIGVAAAHALGLLLPGASALVLAVVLGVLTGHLPFLPASARPGLAWSTRKLLRVGVVLLGLQLSVTHLIGLGPGALLAVVSTVVVTFLGTLLIGRLLGVARGLNLLVATGFSICGASAIAAVEGVADAEEEDVAAAVALVTLYGGLAIAAVPAVGGWLGLAGPELGSWAGLSVHEVAQVVAAAAPAGAAAVTTAVIVKLARVVLLAPLVAIIGATERRRLPAGGGKRPPIVPLFLLGFLAMMAVRSTGLLPAPVLGGASALTTLLLAAALFALGTTVRIPALLRTGARAVLLGLCSTLLIACAALASLHLLT